MGRSLKSYRVTSGRNRDESPLKDNLYVKCSRCRFWCHLDRDMHAPEGSRVGWGVKIDSTVSFNDVAYDNTYQYDQAPTDPYLFYEGTSPNVDSSVQEPVVINGCPFCGTYLYNKEIF